MNLTDAKFVETVETVANYKGVSSVKDILEIAQWVATGAHRVSYADTESNVVPLKRKGKFKIGDRVKIVSDDEWNGLKCVVVNVNEYGSVRLKPRQQRPYGGYGELLWSTDKIRPDENFNRLYSQEW